MLFFLAAVASVRIASGSQVFPAIRDDKARMREGVVANVRLQVQNIKRSASIQRAIGSRKIAVVGAYYEITSGAVDFVETAVDLRVAQSGHATGGWRSHLA